MKRTQTVAALFAAICSAALCLALAGCGSTPTSAVTQELDATKALTEEQISAALTGDKDDAASSSLLLEDLDLSSAFGEEELTQGQADAYAKLMAKLCDFDYTVDNEVIDGDTATVTVTFTAYDFGTLVTDSVSAAVTTLAANSDVLSMSESELEEASAQAFLDAMVNQLDGLTDKTVTNSVEVTVTKSGGKWVFDTMDAETLNAMSGGLYGALSEE